MNGKAHYTVNVAKTLDDTVNEFNISNPIRK
jgi:hypothetical protein